ncbi:MAG: amidohydrolase family protein [Betaproteobacteria bacterium]
MNRTSLLATAVAIALAGAVASCGDQDSAQPATIVLRGGKVKTMDARRSVASAVAVRGDTIVAVGTDAAMRRYIGPDTRVIELAGHTVLPGFIDAHIHPIGGALRLNQCSAQGAALAIADVVVLARACLAADTGATADQWFEVVAINPAGFVASADDVDRISATRPVVLHGIDEHTMWVNHRGLQVAGITAATPDPAGGQIERDAHGEPTGFLKDSALQLVEGAIPALPLARRVTLAKQALDLVRSKGITSIQDAQVTDDVLAVYDALEAEGTLKLRVRADLANDVVDDETQYQRLIATRARYATHRLIRADAVKIFSDGVIEYPTQTAALIHPYLDANGQPTTNFGGRYFTQDLLNRYVARLGKEGFSINVHAIGDYTAHAVLDAFEYAKERNGDLDLRHQISHLQLVDPADFPRFAALGVYANMQLLWAQPDVYSMDAVQLFISAASHRTMYPANSLGLAGAVVVGGSDWPVDVLPDDPMPNQPLSATQVGVTRANSDPGDAAYFGTVLHAEEKVSRDTMLAAYTINAARALKQETTTGSLEVGKRADIAILDGDLDAVADDQIASVHVRTTIFDGGVVDEQAAAAAAVARAARGVIRSGTHSPRNHTACAVPLALAQGASRR